MQIPMDVSWTAEKVMKTFPETIPVFIRLKLDCPGCPLKWYCRLDYISAKYDLHQEDFLVQLHSSIQLDTK